LALAAAIAYIIWAWRGGYVAARDLPALEYSKGEDPNPRPGNRWTSSIDGREMIWVPPGNFEMGSLTALFDANIFADLKHTVRLERGLWMDVNEVTNSDYQRFLQAKPQWQKGRVGQGSADEYYLYLWNGIQYPPGEADHPVLYVSYHAARAYAQWAGKRLPTEAEWEYSCRAGTQSTYWWGNTFDPAHANNTHDTVPVGDARHSNPWGFCDMLGNAGEWTSSSYTDYPYRSDDGRENADGASRVVRGGFIHGHPTLLTSYYRMVYSPSNCSALRGFRCAR
jgi:formylglycine-generating enzyme required for sulfatase activity